MIKLKIKINQKNNMSQPSKLTIWSWDHVKNKMNKIWNLIIKTTNIEKQNLKKKKATKTLELAWVNPSSPRYEIKIT